jgi:hypothetical protein
VHRRLRLHQRVRGGQLGAEVQAFLPVGTARGQLAAEREETAPRTAAQRHAPLHLGFFGQLEKLVAQVFEPPDQRRVHTMARDIEEAVCPAGRADLRGHAFACRRAGHQRRDVDHGQREKIGGRAGHGVTVVESMSCIARERRADV